MGVALDENACDFVIRNKRNGEYALLSDRALTIAALDPDQVDEVDG